MPLLTELAENHHGGALKPRGESLGVLRFNGLQAEYGWPFGCTPKRVK